MKSMVRRIAMGAIVPLLLSSALPATARQVRGEDFEKGAGELAGKAVETKQGRGWRSSRGGNVSEGADMLRLPAASLINPEGGTIELEVVRNNTEDTSEALFSFVDESESVILSVSVEWEGARVSPVPLLEVAGNVPAGRTLWTAKIKGVEYQALQFPGDVQVGEAFHLSFSWGPKAADCGIAVNGKELKGQRGKTLAEELGRLAREAAWVYVGGEPRPGQGSGREVRPAPGSDGEVRPAQSDGANNLMTSLLRLVNVYDQPIDGADLYKNPEKYRTIRLPVIEAVEHDAAQVAGFSGQLVAGNVLGVTLRGTPGMRASFAIAHYPDIMGRLELDWRGWGVYLEDKVFFEPGEVNLRDVTGYRVYAGAAPFDPLAPGFEPVARLKAGVQSHAFELLPVDVPLHVAVVADMRDGTVRPVISPVAGQELTETSPGVYTGSRKIEWGERFPRAVVVGRLASHGERALLVASEPIVVNTALTLAVAAEPGVLKADEKSQSKVTVTVTDANGTAVAGHKLKFLLATTSQYTGVVGGGAFAQQVGGSLAESAWAETDLFGRVSATYVAGFAAKTAIIVARDMVSNDTGAGFVKTFINATAQLELEPVREDARAMASGFEIAVSSSDEWLTADGKSQARITAKVTRAGEPVEGHTVAFAVPSGNGSVRTVKEVTGRNGEARAVYTAGRKIGTVFVTATDQTAGITGAVMIELRSDAPAKIAIAIEPGKLPADGRSRAELTVLVTDINDNPNDNVEVEYALLAGDGRLRDERGMTDRKGESVSEYTAGRTPGMVTIEITVRSTEPSAEELAKARGLALSVTDYDFF